MAYGRRHGLLISDSLAYHPVAIHTPFIVNAMRRYKVFQPDERQVLTLKKDVKGFLKADQLQDLVFQGKPCLV